MPKKTKIVGNAKIVSNIEQIMTEAEEKARNPKATEKELLLYIIELLESR